MGRILPPSLDLRALLRPRALRRLALAGCAGAALGIAHGWLSPKWYRSTVTLVPAAQPRGGMSSLLGSQLGGLAAAFDLGIGGSPDVARIAAVLQGTAVSDAVIERFDLRRRYGSRSLEGARRELWSHCEVRSLAKPGIVQLSCEEKDPALVQAMLTYFAEHGNQVFRRVSVSSASEEVRFLERRVAELRQQADETAARMREFQEKHQIVDLDSQSRAVVSELAALNAKRNSKQMEVDYARTFSSGNEATLQQLESQLGVVDRRLRSLEEAPAGPAGARRPEGPAGASGIFPPAMIVPELRANFERLYRDRKVAEAVLVFALERLEGARATEARDVSTFLVLDPPPLPTRHERPRLRMSLAIGALAALAVAVGIELWRSRRRSAAAGPGAPSADPAPGIPPRT